MPTIIGAPVSPPTTVSAQHTLADLTYRVASRLNITVEGLATGGSTTTIVDTVERTVEDDDYWNGGTAWILKDAAANVAPEGEYQVVTDFVKSTGVVTLRSALTAAVAAGDRYALATKEVRLATIIQAINRILETRQVFLTDTSLSLVHTQSEYAVPSVVSQGLRQVWIQYQQDAGSDRWTEIHNWRTEHNTAGAGDTLYLPDSAMALDGYAIKLVYLGPHPPMYVYSDLLHESLSPELIVAGAVLECLRYQRRRSRSREYDQDIADAQVYYNRLLDQQPLPPPRSGKIGIISFGLRDRYPGDRSTR